MKITNEKSKSFGVYCGGRTGKKIPVTGDYAVITFHSGYNWRRKRGFRILFQIRENGSNATTIGIVVLVKHDHVRPF